MIPADGVASARGSAFPAERALRLAREARDRWSVDLAGLTVLTEGATGYYRVTPVLAALGGAEHVLAAAKDTPFGTKEDAQEQVLDLARRAGVASAVEVRFEASRELAREADVVTNLGAVRPIDAAFAARLGSSRAAVSLMFGACDARPVDIDIAALRAADVPVAAVDEDRIGLFRWTGQRIAWWLTELGIELFGARIVVWGDGAPARRVTEWLGGAGCDVARSARVPLVDSLRGIDALILMDRGARLRAQGSRLRPRTLAAVAPGASVLEYAGDVDRAACDEAGLLVYPPTAPAGGHVARTIGEILYAPVIELHTAGLRVGELMSRARSAGLCRSECESVAVTEGPGERVPR